MKSKILIIITVLFFLVINLSYFWEPTVGLAAIPVTILLIILFFALVIVWLVTLNKIIKEQYENKIRIVATIVLAVVLLLVLLFPGGMIDFSKYENNVLIASREGSANCTDTYKFRADMSFSLTSICFAIEKTNGTYAISGDTIMLYYKNGNEESKVSKAIVNYNNKTTNDLGELMLYKNINDTVPIPLTITKYALK
ncbi:MAG: hypothetical protein ABIN95_02250 [Mucilaginibacter sp.]